MSTALVKTGPGGPNSMKILSSKELALAKTSPTKLPIIPAEKRGGRSATGASSVSAKSNAVIAQKNPFHMPSDEEIFAMRDADRKRRKEAREHARTLKIHEKATLISRANVKQLLDIDDGPTMHELEKREDHNSSQALTTTRDRHVEKENLTDFIAKKREMFLVQYSLGVKRDEMRKLEDIAQAEERKLLDDEKALEEDAAKFDAFLKENDKNSVEAIKRAEQETKAKLEKVAEIKRINANIMAIRSEMSKNEEQLKECQLYKEFLDKLTPSDALVKSKRNNNEGGSIDDSGDAKALEKSKDTKAIRARSGGTIVSVNKEDTGGSDNVALPLGAGESDDPDEEDLEPDLYFTDPQQLLDLFAELEEQNLSLIQNSQETEEALEELKQKISDTQERMNRETESLKQQIEFLEAAIRFEDEKAGQLEQRAKFFSFGVLGVEDQEAQLEELNKKVEEVYRNCIGDNEANIGTLQMLTNIENKLEELFETIEMMPPEKVEQAEKMKDKERRQRLREEKLEAQRLHQEDRVKRALDRAKAPVKKKTGKPLVFRSAPPQKKKKGKEELERKNEEEEEMKYFMTL